MKKTVLILAIAAAVAAFFIFDLNQYLTLENIKSSQVQFADLRNSSPVLVSTVFFAVYTLVTALSLSGAAIMTLAAGAPD